MWRSYEPVMLTDNEALKQPHSVPLLTDGVPYHLQWPTCWTAVVLNSSRCRKNPATRWLSLKSRSPCRWVL